MILLSVSCDSMGAPAGEMTLGNLQLEGILADNHNTIRPGRTLSEREASSQRKIPGSEEVMTVRDSIDHHYAQMDLVNQAAWCRPQPMCLWP